ncbi:hypothetical protein PINS_up008519 [Pythium insidiosum]|nr:hypothetical protein PINS_up008519 [Pythium insidiosum]
MSGRAYARHPKGTLGGATDIESFIPHRFRLAAPKAASRAKELAIRRAIQRQCKEKNWKKVLRLRHERICPLMAPPGDNAAAQAPSVETSVADGDSVSEAPQPEALQTPDVEMADADGTTDNDKAAKEETAPTVEEATSDPAQDEKALAAQRQKEALEASKKELEALEAQLQQLSDEKHAKFLRLKELLVEEAKAKSGSTVRTRRSDIGTSSPRPQDTTLGPTPPQAPAPPIATAVMSSSPATTPGGQNNNNSSSTVVVTPAPAHAAAAPGDDSVQSS